MKIVVTGSLGRIGKPLTEILLKRGHSVTVISSNTGKKEEIEAMGATAALGSVEDLDFLAATFTGADAVHAMIPPIHYVSDPMAHNIKVGLCLTEAIKRSGVQRILYVSSYGAHLADGTGLIAGHHQVENALNKLNLESLTHLRATYIYYNLYAYTPMIKAGGVIAVNYGGDDMVLLVSPEDIAAAAAGELEATTTGNQVRYVASDERSCNEIAQVLGKSIGKPDLKWVTISNQQMQSAMEANGMPATVASQLVEMYGAQDLLREDYDLHKPATMGRVKLEEFAKEFAAAFKEQ